LRVPDVGAASRLNFELQTPGGRRFVFVTVRLRVAFAFKFDPALFVLVLRVGLVVEFALRSPVLRFGVGDSSALRLLPPAFTLFVTRFELRLELTFVAALPLAFALFEFLFLFAFFFGLFALFELFVFDPLDVADSPPF
jgi:hypothetical protein